MFHEYFVIFPVGGSDDERWIEFNWLSVRAFINY